MPRVNISEEPLDRQEVISITVDVQNFVAAISRLKKSMEEADNDGEDKGMYVWVWLLMLYLVWNDSKWM